MSLHALTATVEPGAIRRNAMLRPSLLALSACLVGSIFAVSPAHADQAADIQALQEQIKQLQTEIDGLVATQVKISKKVATPKGAVIVSSPGKGQFTIGKTTITLGGFIAAEGIYRSKSQGSDVATGLSTVAFNGGVVNNASNGPLSARQSEFRESARQTRLSIGVKSKPDSHTTLSGYVEGDFNALAVSSNQKATNSYSPRLRQAWAGYERSDLGLHVFGGQQYSLATQESVGMAPGKEALPPVIDSSQHVGTVNIRQAGLRVFKDFNGKYFIGASLENPQLLTVGSTPASAVATTTTTVLAAPAVSATLAPTPGTTSSDIAPDIIVKGAVDTSVGHYELIAITRFLHSRQGVTAGSVGHSTTRVGGGVGADAFVSVIPKKLDLTANVIWGYGTGRYSSAQLGDVTFDSGGGVVPLQSLVAQFSAIGHVTPTLDVYGVAGVETLHGASHSNFNNGVSLTTAGCYSAVGTACSPLIKQVDEGTVGSWWNFYKGSAGTMQTGFQYSYLRDQALKGAGSSGPHADDNIVMVSFRYYPFK